jgi:hypothetical protein
MIQIKYMDCTLECEFDYEEPDHAVGYNGCVTLEAVWIGENEIYEMLSQKAIDSIEQEIFEAM